jgi:phosphoglycerol transferase MdoB-like AlkP superfamily enzyme
LNSVNSIAYPIFEKTKTTFMQTGLVHLHNLLRWIILILLLVSIFKSYTGYSSKKQFAAGDKKIWLFTMIASHITLLLGLYQWTFGTLGLFTGPNQSFGEVMKNPTTRFFQVEHPVMMILAIVFITLAHGMAKKSVDDTTKYKKAFRYFLIALLLILVAVPWPFRDVARPWFPGM